MNDALRPTELYDRHMMVLEFLQHQLKSFTFAMFMIKKKFKILIFDYQLAKYYAY